MSKFHTNTIDSLRNMEREENDLGLDPRKRLLGTLDPDYVAPPDSKKIKLMKEKGEEELYGRTIKVIEKHVLEEINDLTMDLEDIDDRILKVQQFLHTLRFQASLNLYVYEKVKDRAPPSAKASRLNHPTIRRHLGETSESSADLPTAECLSKNKRLESESDLRKEPKVKLSTKIDSDETMVPKVVPRPALIQDENCQVISHGRKEKFQKKMKIIIGNTYQYLKDSESIDDYMRFKWRVYVRSYSDDFPLTSFISSITFTLDKSYAPHHIIIVREPPFSICRKGWGEFKVYLEFEFTDTRNKSLQLLHPLTLARTGDPLCVTGLWRLGKEVMYDISLYDESVEFCQFDNSDSDISKDSLITRLEEKGLKSETVYSDTEGNVTLAHTEIPKTKIAAEDAEPYLPEHNMNTENDQSIDKQIEEFIKKDASESVPSQSDLETSKPIEVPQTVLNQKCLPKSNLSCIKNVTTLNNDKEITQNSVNTSVGKGQFKLNLMKSSSLVPNQILTPLSNVDAGSHKNLSKILVRQADGSLISVMVPEKMYNMAVKMSAERNLNKSNNLQTRLSSPEPSELNQSFTNRTLTSKTPLSPNLRSPSPLAFPLNISNNNNVTKCNKSFPTLNTSQQTFQLKGSTISTPRVPLIQTSKGTLLRLNPVQSPITTMASRFIQPLAPQLGGLRTRPTHITIPQNKLKVRVSSHNMLNSAIGPLSRVRGSSPIRLTLNNSRINNQNMLNMKKPLFSNSGLANLGKNLNQLSTQGTNSLLKNSIQLGSSKIVYSIPSSISNIKTSSNTNFPTPISATMISNSLSNGESPSSGKVATRRIYISAPPHMVKLREATASKKEAESKMESPISKVTHQSKIKKCEKVLEKASLQVELFEKKKRWLRSRCEGCSSVEEVLHIFMKSISLLSKENENDQLFPFIANSINHFHCYSIGRKRAIEFWRAREIMKELKEMKTSNWECWNTYKIVVWARKHMYTPVEKPYSPVSGFRETWSMSEASAETSTLSIKDVDDAVYSTETEKRELPNLNLDINDSFLILEDSESEAEEGKTQTTKEAESSSTTDETKDSIFIVTPLTANETHFVDRTLSTVRGRIEVEEVLPGVKMEVAKNVLWRATMSFMEDLLRSSFAEVSSHPQSHRDSEKNQQKDSPLVSIESKHVLSVLASGRPQFKLINQFALAKLPHRF